MKVKICGLKTKEAVDVAVQEGADFLGFVFAESTRQITAECVREITKDVPSSILKVGVFVSPTITEVEEKIAVAALDMIQVHGEIPQGPFSVPLVVAHTVGRSPNDERLKQPVSEYLLFDAPPKHYVGGNGEVFDWQQLDLKKFVNKKIFIAGGLTVENVQQAKAYFNPYAVDVSSGVETKGEKDLEKIRQFLRKAKETKTCINNQ